MSHNMRWSPGFCDHGLRSYEVGYFTSCPSPSRSDAQTLPSVGRLGVYEQNAYIARSKINYTYVRAHAAYSYYSSRKTQPWWVSISLASQKASISAEDAPGCMKTCFTPSVLASRMMSRPTFELMIRSMTTK